MLHIIIYIQIFTTGTGWRSATATARPSPAKASTRHVQRMHPASFLLQ